MGSGMRTHPPGGGWAALLRGLRKDVRRDRPREHGESRACLAPSVPVDPTTRSRHAGHGVHSNYRDPPAQEAAGRLLARPDRLARERSLSVSGRGSRMQIVIQQPSPRGIVRMNSPNRMSIVHHRTALVGPSENGAFEVGDIREALALKTGRDAGRSITDRAVYDQGSIFGETIETGKCVRLRSNALRAGQMTHSVLFWRPSVEQDRPDGVRVRKAFGERICCDRWNVRKARRDHLVHRTPGRLF